MKWLGPGKIPAKKNCHMFIWSEWQIYRRQTADDVQQTGDDGRQTNENSAQGTFMLGI